MRRHARTILMRYSMIVGLIPLIILFELVGRGEFTIAIPTLAEVFDGLETASRRTDLVSLIGTSLQSLIIGYVLGVVVGTVVGAAIGLNRTIEEMFGVYVNMLIGAPIAAFVPLIIALFGLGQASIIITVFAFTGGIVTVNAMSGVRSVDRSLLEMARSLNAPRSDVLLRIVLPSAMPLWLNGLKMGMNRAFAGLVLGEILVAIVGIGGLIIVAGSSFRMGELWALIGIVVVMSLAFAGLIGGLQRRLASWNISTGKS